METYERMRGVIRLTLIGGNYKAVYYNANRAFLKKLDEMADIKECTIIWRHGKEIPFVVEEIETIDNSDPYCTEVTFSDPNVRLYVGRTMSMSEGDGESDAGPMIAYFKIDDPDEYGELYKDC